MRTLFLDCGMGAAGDMLAAALLELHPDRAGFLARLNGLGIPGVSVAAESCVKCGVAGTHVRVTVGGEEERSCDVDVSCDVEAQARPGDSADACEHGHAHEHAHAHEHGRHQAHEHHHHGMADIAALIAGLDVPEPVRADALEVYRTIAEAEAQVHGRPVEQVHFHEVGAMDAVTDVVAVCLLMHELAPGRVVASPVNVGHGQVRCAHGILPGPAPATAHILRGIPVYGGAFRGELCTPTGAALLRRFVDEFGPMPLMRVESIGYGMGSKDFEAANCVRAMIGEA